MSHRQPSQLRAAVLVVLSAAPALAAVSWIPGAGNQTIAGVPFATELKITNRDSGIATVQFSFVPTGDPSSAPASVSRTVNPGDSLSLPDALGALFGLSETSGAIRVSFDQAVLIAASRHTLASAPSHFGTDLPVIADGDLLESGAIGDALWVSESGDPTSALSTRFQVYLADSLVTAELRLYDDSGNVVVVSALTSGPRLVELTAASLLSAPLPIGRAELRVSNGRAFGWVEMRNNITGDPMSMAFTPPSLVSGDLLVNGLVHNGQLQSDLRIFNASGVTQDITLQIPGGRLRFLELPRHGMMENDDILNNLFQLTPDGPVTVEITSRSPVVAAVRTSNNGFGEIHAALVNDPASDGNGVTFVYGLPPGAPIGSILARSLAGGSYQATLRGPFNEALASSSSIQVTQNSASGTALSDIFAGVTVPDGARLEIAVNSGLVETALLLQSADAGDPSYREAQVLRDYGCPTPVIQSLSLSPSTLPQPGSVVVGWQTFSADSVSLSSGGPNLAGFSNSITGDVASTTTFELTAANSCGSVVQDAVVTVGDPVPAGLTVLSSDSSAPTAAGAPGQLARVHVDNLSDPSAVDSVLFTATDGSIFAVAPENISDSGDVDARIPFWADSSVATRYRTGSVTVSVLMASGANAGSMPLNILPLSFYGDPVAAFRTILDQLTAQNSDFLAGEGALSDYAGAAQAQTTVSAGYMAALHKIADDLAATGSTTISWGVEPPTPGAPQITVTMTDLTNYLALTANLLTQGPSSLAAAARTAVPAVRIKPDANPLNCIGVRKPLIPICKKLKAGQFLAQQVGDFLGAFAPQDVINYATGKVSGGVAALLAKGGLGALNGKLKLLAKSTEVLCLISPITLKSFTVAPTTIPYTSSSHPTGVSLSAHMVPAISDMDISKNIQKYEVQQYMKQLGKTVQLNSTAKAGLTAFLTNLLQAEEGDFDTQLVSIARNLSLKPTDSQIVGVCDIENFYPSLNGPQNENVKGGIGGVLLEQLPEESEGDLTYHFRSVKPGKETMCIDPYTDNFLFPNDLEFSNVALNTTKNSKCRFKPVSASSARDSAANPPVLYEFSQDVDTGEGMPTLELVYDKTDAWLSINPTPDMGSDDCFDGYSRSGAGDFLPFPENRSCSDGYAMSSITASQAGENSYSGMGSMTGVTVPLDPPYPPGVSKIHTGRSDMWFQFQIPENRDETQSAHVEMKADPDCTGYFYYGASASDVNGNFTTYQCPQPQLCAGADPTTAPPNWTQDFMGAVQGSVSFNMNVDSGSCSVQVTVTLNQ